MKDRNTTAYGVGDDSETGVVREREGESRGRRRRREERERRAWGRREGYGPHAASILVSW